MIKIKLLFATTLIFFSAIGDCFAWGERGHDLVTRIAVQNLLAMPYGHALTRPFTSRDHMLSHLSNVPDIHWRAPYMSDQDRDLNYPTHYIGLEHVYQNAKTLNDIDLDFNTYLEKAVELGLTNPEKMGTAPWRVVQLQSLMTDSLRVAKVATTGDEMTAAATQALLYAGLMSHFVGDLANPHHTTTNYDGQMTGNTGLHAYFEDEVVRALPFNLAVNAAKRSVTKKSAASKRSALYRLVLAPYSKTERAEILADPSKLIFALTLNSHSKVDYLHELDDKYSIITRSTDAKTRATRKAPQAVTRKYQRFIEERIAAGAAVLAQLWLIAWQQAGEPDLSRYRSYEYHIKPEFIFPSYILSN